MGLGRGEGGGKAERGREREGNEEERVISSSLFTNMPICKCACVIISKQVVFIVMTSQNTFLAFCNYIHSKARPARMWHQYCSVVHRNLFRA